MNLKDVYIIKTSHFFPNHPIQNDEMENYLGYINGKPSKAKAIVLRNNGIKTRYYALNKPGDYTHTNAEMTALAVKNLFIDDPNDIKDIDLLTCGTSSPDQMMPSHACMAHGHLPEMGPIEVISPSGCCCSGMHALKFAFMSIKSGDARRAVSTGSERTSALLTADRFEEEIQKLNELEENAYISFDKDFLRWMLSDGAAAVLMSDTPNTDGISLKIEWIQGVSYADQLEACMYMGCEKLDDGSLKSYLEYSSKEIEEKSILTIKQDVKLLSENIVEYGGKMIKKLFDEKNIKPEDINYFLPQMSSIFFKQKIYDGLVANGMEIPLDRWYINLTEVGNVGAAAIYSMLDELFNSGKLKNGEKILMLVPESSRFSYMYCLLTVV